MSWKKALARIAFFSFLLFVSVSAEAQQPTMPKIGFLGATSASSVRDRTEAFRQGLRELGYIEGKNIVIEWKYADAKDDLLPSLAAELVRLKVDLIVTQGSTSTRVAQRATHSIPIVMAATADPVRDGFIASLARPGGNITGLTMLSPELAGKRLELLGEVVPKVSRLAVLYHSAQTSALARWNETEAAARTLGIRLQGVEVRTPEDFEKGIRNAKRDGIQALVVFRVAVMTIHRDRLVNLAIENKLPGIYEQRDYVEAGALMSYDPSQLAISRRAPVYVDKILKGAKPAELPVEQPE